MKTNDPKLCVRLSSQNGNVVARKDESVCWKPWSPDGKAPRKTCCCNCRNHIPVYSHPWADGKPMNHLWGWICAETCLGAMLARRHGLCELHEKGRSQFDPRTINAKDRKSRAKWRSA